MSKPDAPRPPFVFVDNSTERMITMRRTVAPSPGPGQPPEQESTMVGRGLNYVRADYVEANLDMSDLGLQLVDPCKIADGAVKAALDRCTSRQAMHEWIKIEKRPKVLDQIKYRLEHKGAPSTEDAEA